MFDIVNIQHEFMRSFATINDMINKRNRIVPRYAGMKLCLENVSCSYKISDPKFTGIGMTFRNLEEPDYESDCIDEITLSIVSDNSCENVSQRRHPARIDLEIKYDSDSVLKLSHIVDDISNWSFVELDDHTSIDVITSDHKHLSSVNPNWKNEVIQLTCPVFGEDGEVAYSPKLTAFISDALRYFQK